MSHRLRLSKATSPLPEYEPVDLLGTEVTGLSKPRRPPKYTRSGCLIYSSRRSARPRRRLRHHCLPSNRGRTLAERLAADKIMVSG
jgi:hypothetical protein